MVFPSVPLYLDPPSWNQSIIASGSGDQQPLHLPLLHPSDGGPRPKSMAERARLAKIPQQELALKCPRCDSTDTKFCYFNNYSLTQPRHFCKTCRRYWTRGGALRNVPVGGGFRRNNKRSSNSNSNSNSSKSTPMSTSNDRPITTGASSSSTAKSTLIPSLPLSPHMQFLNPMMEYGSGTTNIGLGFHGMQPPVDHYQLGTTEQWRPLNKFHQFPFLGGLEPQLHPMPPTVSGLYSFDGTQEAGKGSVKMEDTPRGLNMASQYLDVTRNNQFWDGGIGTGSSTAGASIGIGSGSGSGSGGGGGWMADFSGFSSLSTGDLL